MDSFVIVFVFACVVGKNPKTPNLSPMTDDAISYMGQYRRSRISCVYLWLGYCGITKNEEEGQRLTLKLIPHVVTLNRVTNIEFPLSPDQHPFIPSFLKVWNSHWCAQRALKASYRFRGLTSPIFCTSLIPGICCHEFQHFDAHFMPFWC